MTDAQTPQNPAGWYSAQGDPPGTKRYWDGSQWVGEPQVVGVTPPAAVSPMAPPAIGGVAPAWKRIFARIIDFLLIVVGVGGLVGALLAPSVDLDAVTTALENGTEIPQSALPSIGVSILAGLALTFLPFLWELVWYGVAGATPAKLLFGMRVIDKNAPGEALGWGGAAKRSLLRLGGLITLVPLVGLLAYLGWLLVTLVSLVFLLSDDNRQTVMDKFAGTVVVDKAEFNRLAGSTA